MIFSEASSFVVILSFLFASFFLLFSLLRFTVKSKRFVCARLYVINDDLTSNERTNEHLSIHRCLTDANYRRKMRKKEQMSDDSIDEDRCHWLMIVSLSLFDDDDDEIPCWILFSSHISFQDIDQLSNKSKYEEIDVNQRSSLMINDLRRSAEEENKHRSNGWRGRRGNGSFVLSFVRRWITNHSMMMIGSHTRRGENEGRNLIDIEHFSRWISLTFFVNQSSIFIDC